MRSQNKSKVTVRNISRTKPAYLNKVKEINWEPKLSCPSLRLPIASLQSTSNPNRDEGWLTQNPRKVAKKDKVSGSLYKTTL